VIFALERRASLCHQQAMAQPARKSGGIFIAMGVLAGLIGGVVWGEPSLGVLIGTAVGIGAAALVWLADRRS
jgi:hypothetical protein